MAALLWSFRKSFVFRLTITELRFPQSKECKPTKTFSEKGTDGISATFDGSRYVAIERGGASEVRLEILADAPITELMAPWKQLLGAWQLALK